MHDPVQHAFESEAFQAQGRGVAAPFGQVRLVNPDPHVAKHQRYSHEHQPQARITGAGIDACLTHLAVARFDTEPGAVTTPVDYCSDSRSV